MYSKNLTVKSIINEFISNGVRTRRNKFIWSEASVMNLFKNTHHDGYWIFTDHKSEKEIRVECPRTVPRKLFVEVQNNLKSRSYKSRDSKRCIEPNVKRERLMSGLLFCGCCGERWNVQTYQKKPNSSNLCSNRPSIKNRTDLSSKKIDCKVTRTINMNLTDETIWDNLVETISKSHLYKETVKENTFGEVSYSRSKNDTKKDRIRLRKLEK